MIRGRFLSAEDRHALIALARDGSAASRVTRRATALVLLDDGWSCRDVARALLLDPRSVHKSDDGYNFLAARPIASCTRRNGSSSLHENRIKECQLGRRARAPVGRPCPLFTKKARGLARPQGIGGTYTFNYDGSEE